MIKYILMTGFICLVLLIVFASLKVASNFDDEIEKFQSNYKSKDLNNKFNYIDNK